MMNLKIENANKIFDHPIIFNNGVFVQSVITVPYNEHRLYLKLYSTGENVRILFSLFISTKSKPHTFQAWIHLQELTTCILSSKETLPMEEMSLSI